MKVRGDGKGGDGRFDGFLEICSLLDDSGSLQFAGGFGELTISGNLRKNFEGYLVI
jgi:hypothetical protein